MFETALVVGLACVVAGFGCLLVKTAKDIAREETPDEFKDI